mgnify:CR=1 FL=1
MEKLRHSITLLLVIAVMAISHTAFAEIDAVKRLKNDLAAGNQPVAASSVPLASGKIAIGNASGVGAAQTISGDITVSNAGVAAIGATKVTKSMLAAALQPSHVVRYAGFATWSGVGKTKKVAIVGAVSTDVMIVTPQTAQTSERLVSAYVLKNNTAIFTIFTGEVNSKSWQYTIHRASQ